MNSSDPKLNLSVTGSRRRAEKGNRTLLCLSRCCHKCFVSVACCTVTQVRITHRLLPQQDFVSLLLGCLDHWKSFCSLSFLKCDLVPFLAPCYQTWSFRAGVQASALPRHLLHYRIKSNVLVLFPFPEFHLHAVLTLRGREFGDRMP